MTNETLTKANKLKTEIDELENFIWKAEKVWEGKIIKRISKFVFQSKPYGVYNSAEYNMNTEVKNKVLDVLKEHLKDLKEQLEKI